MFLSLISATLAYPQYGPPSVPPTGTVYVTNSTPVVLRVSVEGHLVNLYPGRTEPVRAPAGEVDLHATFRAFGADRTLADRDILLRPGRTASVVLTAPVQGLVQVTNDADRPAELLVDGRVLTTFDAGQTRIVSVPVGRHDLAMVSRGWTIDRQLVDVAAFSEPVFLSQMPRVNDLRVSNPLPIPVRVICDRGYARIVEPNGQAFYDDLPLGNAHFRIERITGERIMDLNVSIRPESPTAARITTPTKGLVDVRSDVYVTTRLVVDGRVVRTLAPDQDVRVELSVGSHHVQVLDERGAALHETYLSIDPFGISTVVVAPRDTRQSSRSDADRAYSDGRDHREHADSDHGESLASGSCNRH